MFRDQKLAKSGIFASRASRATVVRRATGEASALIRVRFWCSWCGISQSGAQASSATGHARPQHAPSAATHSPPSYVASLASTPRRKHSVTLT